MMIRHLAALLALASACLATCPANLASADDATGIRGTQRTGGVAEAAELQLWSELAALIRGGADLNEPQADGMTALAWACRYESESAVELLLAAGADVNKANDYQITPLLIACEAGNGKIVSRLLAAGADSKSNQAGGVTPLHLAARAGDVTSIAMLIAAGAEADSRERRKQTPLMWAAAAGNSNAVTALISAGANHDARSSQDFSAMMFAARDGRDSVVQALLDAGVDVNTAMEGDRSGNRTRRDGTSALILATESGHYELAIKLVAAGANPNDQRNGFTPLHIVSWTRKPNRGEGADGDPSPRGSGELSSLDFVRAIVASGADVNAAIRKGSGGKSRLHMKGATPFLLASRTADVPLMKLLIELGADPTVNNVENCTPLMAAAGVGVRSVGEEAGLEPEVIDAINYLVSLGLDVNAIDENNETAMHGAAYRNFPQVVECLESNGANSKFWNHKNASNWTPIRIAQGYRPGSFKPSPETVSALEAAIAADAAEVETKSAPDSNDSDRPLKAWRLLDPTGKPTARHEAALVAFQGKVLLIGGRRINHVDVFDPSTNRWESKSRTPVELHHFQAVVVGDAVYLMGAMTGVYPRETPLEKIVVYYPNEDRFEFTHTIPADRRRGGAGAVYHDGMIYIVGGITNGHIDGYQPWLDAYDPQTGSWITLPDAPHARDHFQAVVCDGKIYAAGGRTTSHITGQVFDLTIPSIDVFDFKSQTWAKDDSAPILLPTPRAGNMVMAWGDEIIVGGGESMAQKVAHHEVEAYNVKTKTWRTWPTFGRGRHGSGFAVVGDHVYIASGSGSRGGSPELESIEQLRLPGPSADQ